MAIKLKGQNAVTNYPVSHYKDALAEAGLLILQDGANGSALLMEDVPLHRYSLPSNWVEWPSLS